MLTRPGKPEGPRNAALAPLFALRLPRSVIKRVYAMKWFKRVAAALGLLLLVLVVAAWAYTRMALPRTTGDIRLPGLQAPISLQRDAHGIPTIVAANAHDAFFGLGLVHAQDRLWQMETHRRIGAGRLAELFGEPALEADLFLRALGVRRAAAEQWKRLPQASKAVLQAYTDGVNAALKHELQARPPEMLLLGVQPEPWDPVDSLAWAIMMAWDLGGNWNTELLRLRLALKMPVARINNLMPPYPGEAPLATTDYAALYRSLKLDAGDRAVASWQRLPDIAPPSGVEGVGSNNWVLAGSRSATGQPLLANDPHLKLSSPALWYFARLQAPGLKVAGATMPGMPLVVLGQNEHVAWGFTNTGPDVQDLYIEQLDPGDPAQVRTPEGWARMETVREVLKVKGKPDVVFNARRTRHGPVISDAGTMPDVLGPRVRPAYVLAMRWTALDPDNDVIGTSLAMQQASSVATFIEATRSFVAPMQNMVVADKAGHIGVVSPGRVPLRKPENDLRGLAPAPGWDARYDWAGFLPPEQTPREQDPERGYIVTANHRITPPGYPHFLTSEWALPYRAQRIEDLIKARPRHRIEDLAAMHADVKSLAAPALLPWLLKAQSSHPQAAAALALLKGFDGTMAADQSAPLLFWAWQRQMARAVFMDDVGDALWDRSLATRSFQDALEVVLSRDDTSWCDDQRTPAQETCAQQAGLALTRALDDLQARYGADMAQWRWGAAHQARSEHRPFSRVKPLARFFELRTPVGGDTHTVNVSRVGLKPDATTGELFLNEHAASLRALYDVADPSQSRVMHSTGQSGLFFSPQYRSFVEPWRDVGYVPLWPREAPVAELKVSPAP